MTARYFTLDEARSLLPRIRPLAEKMVEIAGSLQDLQPQVEVLIEKSSQNAGSPAGTRYLDLLLKMQTYVSDIQSLGCLVKGVEQGLVDFPHLKEGREVYLCWQLGEDDISFWHETDAGFAGRTPLDEEET